MALYFKLLPKILFFPAGSFDEIKGDVSKQDGFFIFLFVSMISIVTFGIIGGSVDTTFMAVPFGFGSFLTGANTIMFFLQAVLILLLSAWIANKLARWMGGSGNFAETFAFFGYAQVINFAGALASAMIAIWIHLQSTRAIDLLAAGVEPPIEPFLAIATAAQILLFVFIAWLIWIQSGAIEVAHDISRAKSVIVSAVSYIAALVAITLLFALPGLII